MKTIIFLSIIPLALPLAVGAHGGMMDFNGIDTGSDMMRYIEDRALGEELHEEMESLMTKMMAGTMTEAESSRMVELMGQYPGPHGMMMVRLGSSQVSQMTGGGMGQSWGWGMMPGTNMMGGGSFWSLILSLTWLVWLLVGVFAIIWLWGKVVKKLG